MAKGNETKPQSPLELQQHPTGTPPAESVAILVSSTQLLWIQTFLLLETLKTTNPEAAKALRKQFFQPVPIKSLYSIYEGIQQRQLLYYATLFWWIKFRPNSQLGVHFSEMTPYQTEQTQQVNTNIIWAILTTAHLASWDSKGFAALEAWKDNQNFHIKLNHRDLKNKAPKNYQERSARRQIWKSVRMEEIYKEMRSALQNKHNPLWEALDILLETPINLYFESSEGNMMSWVQTNLVFIRNGGHSRLETIVVLYKSKQELTEFDADDHYTRLQILLAMFAGNFFHTSLLCRERTTLSKPPFRRINLDASLQSLSDVRVWYVDPQSKGQKGWFDGIDVTLDENPIAASLADLEQVISLLHSPRRLGPFKKFLKKKKATLKGTSPSVETLDTYVQCQLLLIPPES